MSDARGAPDSAMSERAARYVLIVWLATCSSSG
jgi:hypothetical protein